MPPTLPPQQTPPGISPYLSCLTESGPVQAIPTVSHTPDNILGECSTLHKDLNLIESSLQERLHAKMAIRRATKRQESEVNEEGMTMASISPQLTTYNHLDSDSCQLLDEGASRLTDITPIDTGSLHMLDDVTLNPLYANPLCTKWSDDASRRAPILNPLYADALCTKWPDKATADLLQSPPLPDLASRYEVVSAWPDDLVERVQAVVNHSTCGRPSAPEFQFELSHDAAEHNAAVLKLYGFHLGAAIEANSTSPLGYGSEFRPVHVLKPLFECHPNWNRLKSLLTVGSKWPLDKLDDDMRKSDLTTALTFGNHKGASSQPELLRQLIEKDITHGFALVIPLSTVKCIPGALLAPMNIMKQNTIDEFGNIIPKDRLTHDQSYKWSSGTSVNSRVQFDKLLPCRFGACIRRIANYAVAARRKYPNRRILATKADYKSAYRRCHLYWETAVQTITQLPDDDLAIISLRLTFGGAPGPFEWGVISESICDLANALLHDDDWDPATLSAPSSVPPKNILSDDIPFGIGRELIVDLPVDPRGKIDCYIDDTVGITVDLPDTDNCSRMERASLLAIHATSRPIHKQEPLPRDEMAAKQKLFAEGALEEQKIILGWLFDFRRLIIALPENKFVAWSDNISTILATGKTTPKELEQLIGRLGHLSTVVPMIHHFLSRLRDLHFRFKNRRGVALTVNCARDLGLMLEFLNMARKGVDMNLIAYLAPTHVYYSDSCPAGLGGYSRDGYAWRFYIPPDQQFRASNNLLEFIAAIITPWIDIIAGRLNSGDCSLSMTDSTTAEGWMHKTNFRESEEDQVQIDTRIEVARKFALDFTIHGIKSYSQWFPGKENIVADALSRDDDRSDDELTSILYCLAPHQMPNHFEIVPLPNEIVSWLTSLLSKLPVKEQYRETHTRSSLGRGVDGLNIAHQLDLPIPTLTDSTNISASSSWQPLPWLCAKDDSRVSMEHWLKAQSAVPSQMWFRPSGRMDGPIQPKTTIWSLDGFYTDCSEPSRMKIQK